MPTNFEEVPHGWTTKPQADIEAVVEGIEARVAAGDPDIQIYSLGELRELILGPNQAT